MAELEDHALDPHALEEGRWFEGRDGWTFLARSLRSKAARAVIDRQNFRDRARVQRSEPQRLGEAERNSIEIIVDGCLIDWKGLTRNGEPIPYSRDTAREILGNPRYKRFLDDVSDAVGLLDSFAVDDTQAAETDAGN